MSNDHSWLSQILVSIHWSDPAWIWTCYWRYHSSLCYPSREQYYWCILYGLQTILKAIVCRRPFTRWVLLNRSVNVTRAEPGIVLTSFRLGLPCQYQLLLTVADRWENNSHCTHPTNWSQLPNPQLKTVIHVSRLDLLVQQLLDSNSFSIQQIATRDALRGGN